MQEDKRLETFLSKQEDVSLSLSFVFMPLLPPAWILVLRAAWISCIIYQHAKGLCHTRLLPRPKSSDEPYLIYVRLRTSRAVLQAKKSD